MSIISNNYVLLPGSNFTQPFPFTVRFVESANDEQISITTDEGTCVRKAFSGNGFRLKGDFYYEMFVSIKAEYLIVSGN